MHYEEYNNVIGLATISDEKSHKTSATWASVTEMFNAVDFTGTKTLYIASDSLTSQYRDKKNVLMAKKRAVKNNIELC